MRPVARAGAAFLGLAVLSGGTASAIQPTAETSAFRLPEGLVLPDYDVQPSLVLFEPGGADLPDDVRRFAAEERGRWEVRWDVRNDRPHLIQGSGVPLLPGRGNRLTRADLGLPASGRFRVEDVEKAVRAFMARYPELFRIAPENLRLDRAQSTAYGPDDRLWFVVLQQVHEGVPVEGANVFFRINHGNLVQFGSDRVAEVGIGADPALAAPDARRRGIETIGMDPADVVEVVNPGTLKLYPVPGPGERAGEPYAGLHGFGYEHRLVWETTYRRRGDAGTYKLAIDAQSGVVLSVTDINTYATVTGGIYPVTNTDAEVVRPLPFTTLSTGAVTDAAGVYNYTGVTTTATLNGQYFRISDACGAISLAGNASGNINFGTSGGTDCTTPGVGGAGNTHAARSSFYHLTNVNRKAAGFLSSNAWLNSKVTVNTNINMTCNAFWNGSTINFYRSGGGCSNTGELAAVYIHEWGHGMDTNTGGAAPGDQAAGEAVGDTFALLQTKDGCIGQNFTPGQNCTNCINCTGVRDVADFSMAGGASSAKIAKPANIANNGSLNCDRFACPYASFRGPMGYEGHCESVIASSANWDLTQNLVAAYGTSSGWAAMDSLWYGSLTPSKSAYRVVSGGTCNPSALIDGCGATNWYTVYLAVDDNDGNLANGTPNACRIWDAFNAHGIACGKRPSCSGGGGPAPTPTPGKPTATPTPIGPQTTSTPTSTPIPSTPTPTPVPGGGNCSNLSYAGTAGTFRWRVYSRSGSGSYTFCSVNP